MSCQAPHRLIYATQCPNCMRFVGALDRTPAKGSVLKVDINQLPHDQRRQVSAVPTLLLSNGTALVGTQAFEWLKQFEAQTELESFALGKGLLFSDYQDDGFALSFSTPFSAFEPVP